MIAGVKFWNKARVVDTCQKIIYLILFTELAVKCCYEAGVWYHRILESLISQERKRLGFSDISVSARHLVAKDGTEL